MILLLFPPLETYMNFTELVEDLMILVFLAGFPLKYFFLSKELFVTYICKYIVTIFSIRFKLCIV